MKIAICNETFRDWPMEKAFRYAAELGYQGIEIAPFTIQENAFDITESNCADMVALASECELEIIGLHWLLAFTEGLLLTSPDPHQRKRTADYLVQLAHICHRLGGEVMVLGSPAQRNRLDGVSVEDANNFAIACINDVVPKLEQLGVVLALEPLGPQEGNFLLTAEWARELIQRIGSESVKLHLDVKAMSSESLSIPEIIAQNKDLLVHFHTNDPNLRGPGMGEVEYAPIINALRQVGYDGWLSVEVFDEVLSPEELAGESIRNLKQFVSD